MSNQIELQSLQIDGADSTDSLLSTSASEPVVFRSITIRWSVSPWWSWLRAQTFIYCGFGLVLSTSFLLFIWFSLFLDISCVLDENYTTPFFLDASRVVNTSRLYEVVLFGDSMIGHPERYSQLSKKLQSFMPEFKLNITALGYSGSGIEALRYSWLDRVLANTTEHGHIDAMIMLWDSDVSDENWRISREDILEKKRRYIMNTAAVIQRILSTKPGIFLAIAGPLMYGEGPLFAPLRRYDHVYDYRMYSEKYDEFITLNQALCIGLNITYIDIRSTFLNLIPKQRHGFRGNLLYYRINPNNFPCILLPVPSF